MTLHGRSFKDDTLLGKVSAAKDILGSAVAAYLARGSKALFLISLDHPATVTHPPCATIDLLIRLFLVLSLSLLLSCSLDADRVILSDIRVHWLTDDWSLGLRLCVRSMVGIPSWLLARHRFLLLFLVDFCRTCNRLFTPIPLMVAFDGGVQFFGLFPIRCKFQMSIRAHHVLADLVAFARIVFVQSLLLTD